jgi:hypothetical protein
MNFATCFFPVAVSLKRGPMAFVLAMAAIYGVMPAVARADFTMQYTGAAFDPNATALCGLGTNPYVACLTGRLNMTIVLQADLPTTYPTPLCLRPFAGALTTTP